MYKELKYSAPTLIDPTVIQPRIDNRLNYWIVKRVVDCILASLLLVLFLPILLLIALLIVIDSPGPVFFIQKRIGARRISENGNHYWFPELFGCFKFRTMVNNADPNLHKEFIEAFINNNSAQSLNPQGEDSQIRKITCDPRITRVGYWLRKTSLDEFPQFLNVIRNEMSIVGPRPAIPYEVENYEDWHMARLYTKPGMTGLWQVTARSSCEFDEMVALDIDYIRKQSFWLDLKIVLKTPFVVISCKGAH
jgi:lipopolysaccharide/colanic/teichoic acid biosynthesis glycosyltransferase